ncbi:MAG: FG-GAP-like repeat-containing protein, partial [Myxococcota bacterium]|nr:FG-GAP-like repeat-containing protein [Myxococcota bacterium]
MSDQITGLELTVPVGVVEPISSATNRSGDLTDRAVMLAHDFDGDGWPELVLGVGEADVDALDSGAVYLYRGTEDGLESVPERVYATDDKGAMAGQALAVGDFDGDGTTDLAVGVPEADPGVKDGGAVRIYAGQQGDMPGATVVQTLGGPFAGDKLGSSVVACDFNADGVDDLVATAKRAENRALVQPFNEQGAVFLYLGHEGEGLSEVADQIIYGHVLVEGELEQRMGLLLGHAAAAGDFDGDGACDLVVSTVDWSFEEEGANRQDGGVFLYRGQHAEPGVSGGIEVTPSRVWAANDEEMSGSRFGWGLLAADLNGDGLADVVANQGRYLNPEAGGNTHGALNVFFGELLPNQTPEAPIPVQEADWRVEGDKSGEGLGNILAFGDVGLDGSFELVVGVPM